MKSRAATTTPPELEPFLYAEIGQEENGMVLTVASAFARLGLDPWQQASVLARLSEAAATASLASLIGRLQFASHSEVPRGEVLAIASRLVPLLPKEAELPRPGEAAAAAPSRGSIAVWLFWGVLAAAVAYMVWF
jgi:hypothetical protein